LTGRTGAWASCRNWRRRVNIAVLVALQIRVFRLLGFRQVFPRGAVLSHGGDLVLENVRLL
jgi:hypothetical protein